MTIAPALRNVAAVLHDVHSDAPWARSSNAVSGTVAIPATAPGGAPPCGRDDRHERGEGGLGTKRGVNPAVGEDEQDPARNGKPPPGYKNRETSLEL